MSADPGPGIRIREIRLTDFRAFPGPNPTTFTLDGKNLLVYGENGAGKSSLFHALRDFFRPAALPGGAERKALSSHKNIYTEDTLEHVRVEVESTRGEVAAWSHQLVVAQSGGATPSRRFPESHPLSSVSAAWVSEAALRASSLDYRAILDTNYKHGDGQINLFDVTVDQLLRGFPVTIAGGQVRSVGRLWSDLNGQLPKRHTGNYRDPVQVVCVQFNEALRFALDTLLPAWNGLLTRLGTTAEVEVSGYQFGGVRYNDQWMRAERGLIGKTLLPEISFRGQPLAHPHLFLNEARLSALGLALYLAGRKVSVPADDPQHPDAPLKLIVLDDVLIGLDHSNRLPVLEVLQEHFADWQIVLLTHDRVWYEMARMHAPDGYWNCVEMYEEQCQVREIMTPVLRSTGANAASAQLEQARAFLARHEVPAAANYARSAFELALKAYCEKRGVPVPYSMDPRKVQAEALLNAVENWEESKGANLGALHPTIFRNLRLYRGVVLNPYSHSAPNPVARREVAGAIVAVSSLVQLLRLHARSAGDGNGMLCAAREISTIHGAGDEEHDAALHCLRTAFRLGLEGLWLRKAAELSIGRFPKHAADGWRVIKQKWSPLAGPGFADLAALLDQEAAWLIADRAAAVPKPSQADIQRLLQILDPAGAGALILDGV